MFLNIICMFYFIPADWAVWHARTEEVFRPTETGSPCGSTLEKQDLWRSDQSQSGLDRETDTPEDPEDETNPVTSSKINDCYYSEYKTLTHLLPQRLLPIKRQRKVYAI